MKIAKKGRGSSKVFMRSSQTVRWIENSKGWCKRSHGKFINKDEVLNCAIFYWKLKWKDWGVSICLTYHSLPLFWYLRMHTCVFSSQKFVGFFAFVFVLFQVDFLHSSRGFTFFHFEIGFLVMPIVKGMVMRIDANYFSQKSLSSPKHATSCWNPDRNL